jgi:hypothetical protein
MPNLDEISDEEAEAGALTAMWGQLEAFAARSGLDLRAEVLEDLTDEEFAEAQRTVAFMRAGFEG